MKDSLSILIETKEGRNTPVFINGNLLDEKLALRKLKKLKTAKEKENFLVEYANISDVSYPSLTIELIKLIKKKNPIYAYDLAVKLCKKLLTDPNPYILIGEIGIENKAWEVSKSALEIAKWFLSGSSIFSIFKVNKLLEQVNKQIKENQPDNSKNNLWKEKVINKSQVLYHLFSALDEDMLFSYSVRLLKLSPGNKNIFNYFLVQEILALTNSSDILRKFAQFIKNDKSVNKEMKFVLLGIVNYSMDTFTEALFSFEQALEINPGNLYAKHHIALIELIKGNTATIIDLIDESLSPEHLSSSLEINKMMKKLSPPIKLVLLIYMAIKNIQGELVFDGLEQKAIGDEIIKLFKKLIKQNEASTIDYLVSKFVKSNYHLSLPFIFLYLAELFIKENKIDKAKELLDYISEDNEVYRLRSWIYRIEKNEKLAEEELAKYRKGLDLTKSRTSIYKTVPLKLPDKIPSDEVGILEALTVLYNQVENLKSEIALEYGINRSTCFDSNCYECCTKTYPFVSYTEYLYMRKWFEKQPEDFKRKIQTRSFEILDKYKKKFNREANFVGLLGSVQANYPLSFNFDCPFLIEGQCSAYEVQPFICRAYGYTSNDSVSIISCNYYTKQFEVSSGLDNVRKLIDSNSFSKFKKAADVELIVSSILAPLPLWFSYTHEEAKLRAKTHLLSGTIFKPLVDWLIKINLKSGK